jgi:hypothetical protein
MSEAGAVEVETPPDTEAGFCRPFDPALLEADDRERAREHPPIPVPPMANVALAIELATGLDAIRERVFHGVTYGLHPTPFHTGLRLLVWSQHLERIAQSGTPLDECLPELRACYAELIGLLGSLLVTWPTDVMTGLPATNPFLEAQGPEVQQLASFALDSGNEVPYVPARPSEEAEVREAPRYDAMYYLLRYLAVFGAVPGMVDGRGSPATWRHFMSGCAYLRRAEAEQALATFGAFAVAQSNQEGQEAWLALQRREIGQP